MRKSTQYKSIITSEKEGGDILELNEILQSASNYGFPMLISCYLLVRMESRMNELTEALNKLCVALEHK